MASVASSIEERTGHRIIWNNSSAADAEVTAAVDKVLADELTAESAVQIALLNNRSLQATFEEIGIAQADLVQAGLLKNPIFEAKLKYAEAGGGTGMELNAVADFLDIFLIPLRKKIAAANLVAAQHRVTGEAISLAGEVKKDFYELLAAKQAMEARKTVAVATETGAEFARRMHKAGNLSDLDLNQNVLVGEQAKLELAKQELEVTEAQERLAAAMGLWGERAARIRVPEQPAWNRRRSRGGRNCSRRGRPSMHRRRLQMSRRHSSGLKARKSARPPSAKAAAGGRSGRSSRCRFHFSTPVRRSSIAAALSCGRQRSVTQRCRCRFARR
jgi:hypothetical protein